MNELRAHDVEEIEGLLATRQQLMGWIGRLEAAGARAPESVRAKVRADYRARLANVVDQLRTHADLIASSLEGLLAQSRQFRQSRAEQLNIRSEAELRHAVGEYSDEQWQQVDEETSGKIASFDLELERLTTEIHRLEEVQSLIAPQAPSAEVVPERKPRPEPDLVVTHDAEIPAMITGDPLTPSEPPTLSLVRDEPPQPRPEAPRFVPRAGAPKPRESGSRAIPFPQAPAAAPVQAPVQAPAASTPAPQDELAFLRSVGIDPAPPAVHPVTGVPASALGSVDREDRPGQTAARTLKCGECGSMNRPTEWYCERCGAELAAL
jgi:hypothetical protein